MATTTDATPINTTAATSTELTRLYSDSLTQAAFLQPVIRFLEYSLRPDGKVIALANAYRQRERDRISRHELDRLIADLEEQTQRETALARFIYRSGDLRFLRGDCDDPQFWTQFTGLKFNLLSVDARQATDLEDLATAFDALIHHGLIDSDGFTLLCQAPQMAPRAEFNTLFRLFTRELRTRLHASEQNAHLLDFGGVIRHPGFL